MLLSSISYGFVTFQGILEFNQTKRFFFTEAAEDQTNMSRLNIRRDTMALIQRRGSTFATNQRRRSSVGGAGAFSSRTSFATSRLEFEFY